MTEKRCPKCDRVIQWKVAAISPTGGYWYCPKGCDELRPGMTGRQKQALRNAMDPSLTDEERTAAMKVAIAVQLPIEPADQKHTESCPECGASGPCGCGDDCKIDPAQKHTALPWRIGKSHTTDTAIRESDGECLAVTLDGFEEHRANAEFICRAVNSHYELLEALKQIAAIYPCDKWVDEEGNDDTIPELKGRVLHMGDIAQAAIEKAEK